MSDGQPLGWIRLALDDTVNVVGVPYYSERGVMEAIDSAALLMKQALIGEAVRRIQEDPSAKATA